MGILRCRTCLGPRSRVIEAMVAEKGELGQGLAGEFPALFNGVPEQRPVGLLLISDLRPFLAKGIILVHHFYCLTWKLASQTRGLKI